MQLTTEQSEPAEGFPLGTYLAVIGRRKWLVVGVMVLFVALGYAYLKGRTPMYSASAELLYAQPANGLDPLAPAVVDQTLQQADLGSVPAVLNGSAVSARAAQLLAHTDTSAGYSVTALLQLDTQTDAYSNIVAIDGVSSSPSLAAAVANAYARAFVGWRQTSAQAQVGEAVLAVQSRLGAYTTPTSQATADYVALRQLLGSLLLQQKTATGDFTILSPADLPSAPFSPRKLHTLGYAATVGLLLGLGLAFLLEQLDGRVTGEEELRDSLGLPALGHLPPLKRGTQDADAVQTLSDPASPAAEAFRTLRGNLQLAGGETDVPVLLVTSSVQGEGKSVTACNLAVSLTLAGQRVVLVDADLRRPRVHSYMGVSSEPGLTTVLARGASVQEVLVPVALDERHGRGPDDPVLKVLPAGSLPPNPGELVASQRFVELIAVLAREADVVVIDSPALLAVGDCSSIAATADALVFVVNTAKVRRAMLERAGAQLRRLPCRKLGFIVVEAKPARQYRYDRYRPRSRHAAGAG